MIAFIGLMGFLLISAFTFEPASSYGPSYVFNPYKKNEIKDPELIRLRKKLNKLENNDEIQK